MIPKSTMSNQAETSRRLSMYDRPPRGIRSTSVSAIRISSNSHTGCTDVADSPKVNFTTKTETRINRRSSSVTDARRASGIPIPCNVIAGGNSESAKLTSGSRPYERRGSSVTSRRCSTLLSSSMDDLPKLYPLGSRAPEVFAKRKKLYNTQVTSVASVIYDENWASKQTKSYTDWLNHVFFASMGSYSISVSEMDGVAAQTLGSEGISNPELENCGLKELIIKKTEAANRQKASKINKNQAVVIKKLEQEICNKTFELRSDRNIMVDLGLQDSLLNILFSYELPWIRLGLETIFGEIISVQSPYTSTNCPCRTGCVKWKNSIKFFIQQKLFSTNTFTLKSVIYDQNVIELSHQNILKKVLSLIYFLDNARLQKVLHCPRLFNIESNRKSTKEILFAFHSELMRGKGDITKYLNLTGLTVYFTQSYLDEYDFSVKNLTTDLRDGVRLARLMDILTHTRTHGTGWGGISDQLRVPANSRLQKLHNVGSALKSFYQYTETFQSVGEKDSTLRVQDPEEQLQEAKEIVDGQQDTTLSLLWKIIYTCELRNLVDPLKVLEEAQLIRSDTDKRLGHFKFNGSHKLSALAFNTDTNEKITNNSGAQKNFDPFLDSTKGTDENSLPLGDVFNSSALTNSLLKWCNAISSTYGVNVHNFTNCLSDGRVLCYMVHYYHPTLLRLCDIQSTTATILSDHYKEMTKCSKLDGKSDYGFSDIGDLDSFMEGNIVSNNIISRENIKKGLEGEKRNFHLIQNACSAIGGIPLILPIHDTSDVPEARTIIMFLGFLFSRLMETSKQIRAAIKIQKMCRMIRFRILRYKSATVIQSKYRAYVQCRIYGNVIREWREYKACCDFGGEICENENNGNYDYEFENENENENKNKKYELERQIEKIDMDESFKWDGDFIPEAENFDRNPVKNTGIFFEANESFTADFTFSEEKYHDSIVENGHISVQPDIPHDNTENLEITDVSMEESTLLDASVGGCVRSVGHAECSMSQECSFFDLATHFAMASSLENVNENDDEKTCVHLEFDADTSPIKEKKNTAGIIHAMPLNNYDTEIHRNRCVFAVQIISRWYISFLPKLRIQKLLLGFRRLQACFRGNKIRSISNERTKNMCVRIRTSSLKASGTPGVRLEILTQDAISAIETGESLPLMLPHCSLLSDATQLSLVCCEVVVRSNKCSVLLSLIRSCTRSEDHQELLRKCLNTLLNICRHKNLTGLVAESADCADTIVDLMQMFRDKKEIVSLSSRLLSILILASPTMKATCSGGVHRIRLEGILHIVDRKQKLDDRVKKIQHQKQQLLYQNQDKENISDQIREDSNENEKDAKFEMICFRKNVLEEDSSLQCLRNIMNILQET